MSFRSLSPVLPLLSKVPRQGNSAQALLSKAEFHQGHGQGYLFKTHTTQKLEKDFKEGGEGQGPNPNTVTQSSQKCKKKKIHLNVVYPLPRLSLKRAAWLDGCGGTCLQPQHSRVQAEG